MNIKKGDLKDQIKKAKKRNLDERKILDWILQATNGIMHLHFGKIIHRDIKPEYFL